MNIKKVIIIFHKLMLLSVIVFFPGLLIFADDNTPTTAANNSQSPEKSSSKIIIVDDSSYAPFAFIDAEGKPRGISIDIWKLWSKKTGIEVEFHLMEWDSALAAVREGRADVVGGLFRTPQREEYFDFTKPYFNISTGIFFHEQIRGISGMEDLGGFSIGAVRGDSAEELIKAKFPNTIMELYPGAEDLVKSACDGRVKVFIADSYVVHFYMAKIGKGAEFREAVNPVANNKQYAAVKKGNSKLLDTIQRGLDMISENEKKAIVKAWSGNPAFFKFPWSKIIIVLVIIVLVLYLMILWNIQLKRRVAKATKDLQQKNEDLQKSERNYREIFNASSDMVFLHNSEDGKILDVNQMAAELSGYSRDELIGKTVGLISADTEGFSGDGALSQIRKSVKEGVHTFEWLFRRKNGDTFWTEVALRSSQIGGENRVLAVVRDITGRKQAESKMETALDALKESENKLRSIFASMTDVILIINSEGRYIEIAPTNTNLLFKPPSELLGKTVSEVFPPEQAKLFLNTINKVLLSGKMIPVDYSLIIGDTEIWFSGNVSPLSGENVIWVARDITDRKFAEKALLESEVRFKTLFDLAPYSCAVNDEEGRYIMVNKTFCAQSGFSLDEIIGRRGHEIGRVYDRESENKIKDELMHEGEISNYELTVKNKKSEPFQVIISSKVIEVNGRRLILSAATDITERNRAEIKLRQREKHLQAQNDALLSLMMSGKLFKGDFQSAVKEITKVCGKLLDVERTGVWQYSDDYKKISCLCLYELSKNEHSSGEELCSADFPEYAKSHRTGNVIVAVNVYKDFRTKEIPESYYKQHDIYSLMDAPIWLGENVSGIFSFEAVGKEREWMPEEERLANIMATMISLGFEISERKRTEEALRESERRLSQAISGTSDAIWEWNLITNKTYYSPRWFEMLGYNDGEFEMTFEVWKNLCHPEDLQQTIESISTVLNTEGSKGYEAEFRMKHKDGSWKWILGRGNVVERTPEGKPLILSGTNTDINEHKQSEAEHEKLRSQLAQAQKMESVGRLAGGVAHDFNNMLSVILGNAELTLSRISPAESLYDDIVEIQKAARRSAELTKQLLAFARRQTVAPRLMDLNDTVSGMLKMLRRLIGEDIDLVWIPGAEISPINIDPSQIDQILANLCINARDAISGVGKVTIETYNTGFNEEYCANHPGFAVGEYVMLAVSDNGCGMDKETLEQVFEPFFTTKNMGHGTGLGLATIYGIVKQNNGFINVYSEPEKGTTFKIYFPRITSPKTENITQYQDEIVYGNGETILIVEDEPAILKMGKTMLERLRYNVLGAKTPNEAEQTAREHSGVIHLLITDVVMPEMNGRELAKKIIEIKPDIKCLFMSGYTANVIAHHGVLDKGVNFIQKPFSMQDLASKTHLALNK